MYEIDRHLNIYDYRLLFMTPPNLMHRKNEEGEVKLKRAIGLFNHANYSDNCDSYY